LSDIIKLDPRNYRKHGDKNKKLIRNSLKNYGAGRSIVIDGDDVVIAGNGVYDEARKIGLKVRIIESDGSELIAIKRTDLKTDDEKRKLLAIADNKTSDTSEFDFDLLTDDFDINILEDLGFEDIEINLFKDDVELEEDDFEVELPENPVTQKGDLYQLGRHRLICGDSTNADDIDNLMQGDKARLVFTDPPYNVDYKSPNGNSYNSKKYGGSGGKIFNDNKSDEDCIDFYTDVLKNLYRVTTDDAPIYWWYALRNYVLSAAAFNLSGWHISQTIIWLKESMVFSRGQDYHRCYEPCMFGWKKGKNHFKVRNLNTYKDVFALSREDYRDAMDLWFERRDATNEYVHPTQKPIRLAERAFRKHTRKDFIVIDMFGGSGSTLIACEQSDRVARIVELDPKYCDVIVKRYVKYCKTKNIKPVVIKNGEDISGEDWFQDK